jgi:hypothetical protein
MKTDDLERHDVNDPAEQPDISEFTIPGQLKKQAKPMFSWIMHVKVFNMLNEEHIKDLEEIYTKASNNGPNSNTGIRICYENGRFFEDGSFRVMMRWGEWTRC